MTCREATEFLTDYLARDLPAAVLREFEAHLARCPECRTFLSQYDQTIRAGRRVCAEGHDDVLTDFPEDLLTAIMAAIKASP